MSTARRPQDASDALNGDPRQLEALTATILSVVRQFRLSNTAVAEDLVQDALARVLLALRTGRFRADAALTTYAHSVAKYVCLEHMRRRPDAVRSQDPDLIASSSRWAQPEEELLRAEEHQANLRVLAAMPAECHELFRMIFLENLSYQEIARRFGISEGAVKTRVRRCRLSGQRPERDTS